MRKFILLIIPFFQVIFMSNAQQGLPCGTVEMMEKAFQQYPELRRNIEISDSIALLPENKIAGRIHSAKRIIPVVIHVMHNNGPENVSRAQVLDAIRIVNEDFNKRNPDTGMVASLFQPIIGNSEIEFRLAGYDPEGNFSDGITRTQTAFTNIAGENVKTLVAWPADKYLNIWVVNSIESGAGGYAYYPGGAPPGGDGIVVRSAQFGSIGASGGSNFSSRTLTHEIGHYLNLAHIWGSSNTPGQPNNCNIDDGVEDTPNTVGSSGCNLNQMTCDNTLDNVNNYMDYSNCGRMFTQGQSARMNSALNSTVGARNNLWTNNNTLATGTKTLNLRLISPVFGSNLCQNVLTPEMWLRFMGAPTLSIINVGYVVDNGTPHDSSYILPFGLPAYSWVQLKMGRIDLPPGAKKLKLFFSRPNTLVDFDLELDTVVIDVNTNLQPTYFAGYANGFESSGPVPVQWKTSNGTSNGFQKVNLGGFGNSNYSMVCPAFTHSAADYGRGDSLIMPIVDITNASGPLYVHFNYAYARRPSASFYNDSLIILVSKDCGQTYTRVWSKWSADPNGNNTLTTAPNSNGYYVPQSTHWRKDSAEISSFVGFVDKIRVVFVVVSGRNNNVYVDDISINGPNVDPRQQPLFLEVETGNLFLIYPNPTNSRSVKIMFGEPLSGSFEISITNVLGQAVMRKSAGNAGEQGFNLDLSGLSLQDGMYLVEIVANGRKEISRLIIAD